MKFVSWNLDGINAVLRKSNFMNNLLMWKADIYAFQETKTLARDIRIVFPSYHDYWSFHTTNKLPSPQSGVVTVSKWKAIKQFTSFPQAPDFDTEGRLLVLEYDFFYFVNVYVPQSQDAVAGKSTERSMNRREYRAKFDRLFRDYMISLNKVKPVIIGGDFNASISSLDMSSNSRWQDEGFMKDANNQLLKLTADTFRSLHPKKKNAFTHWHMKESDTRDANGRRLDYFFISDDLKSKIEDAAINPNVKGSDHAPITLKLDMSIPVIRNEHLLNLTYDDLLLREQNHMFFYALQDSSIDLTQAWDTIDWNHAKQHLAELQCDLAKIAYGRDPDKIRNAQFKLVTSLDAKLLAVQSVTSRKGQASLDHVKWATSNEKMHAAISLTSKDYTAKTSLIVRRMEKGKMRNMHVDTYYDRAMQTLYGYSLAPVAECWSDRKSFATRKGRNTPDANHFVIKIFSGENAPLWAVKTDVKKCYESIDHDWIRTNIPLASRVLNEFLRMRYFVDDRYVEHNEGIGIGSRLSPYLANMSMDGLQDYIYDHLFPGRGDDEIDWDNGNLIRFADDILVSARSYDTAVMIRQYIRDFLCERGLTLSDDKTEIVYVPDGFDYLKRHYRKEGDYMIASPSDAAISRFMNETESFILSYKGSPENLVEDLNKKIVGFVSNHKMTDAWDAFKKLDIHIRACLMKLCERTCKGWSRDKIMEKFWIRDHNRITYAVRGASHKQVIFMQDTLPTKYNPLPLHLNPYIDFDEVNRLMGSREMQNMVGKYKALWQRQDGCCEYCHCKILRDDVKEVVEVDPTAGNWIDRNAYIHSRCKDAVFEDFYKDPEYEESDNSIKLLMELSDTDSLDDLENNPLYQFFSAAEKSTLQLSFKQIGEILGEPLDLTVASLPEFWLQDASDKLCRCWLNNGYFVKRISTKNRRYVVFHKYRMTDETAKVEIPDLLLHGEVPIRLKYKLETLIKHEMAQYGLSVY